MYATLGLKNVNVLEMSSLKKSKRKMKYSGCPLNSKIIQDGWRLTRKIVNTDWRKQSYPKIFNKDVFSKMTVSLAVQLLSSFVVTMLKKKATNDITIIPDIRLK